MATPRITPEAARARLARSEPLLFLDTRSPRAWDESDVMIPGALRIAPSEVGNHTAEFPKQQTIVTYCT